MVSKFNSALAKELEQQMEQWLIMQCLYHVLIFIKITAILLPQFLIEHKNYVKKCTLFMKQPDFLIIQQI